MRCFAVLPLLAVAAQAAPRRGGRGNRPRSLGRVAAATNASAIAPKVLSIQLYGDEEGAVLNGLAADNFTLAHNFTLPGASVLYPSVRCTSDYGLCQFTTGEGEINAAASTAALFNSPYLNLTQTYIIVAGIAGANADEISLASAGWAYYLTSFSSQYEIDARELPSVFNDTTGYWGYGTTEPGVYPTELYGTEFYGLNTKLADKILQITSNVTLNDTSAAAAQRAAYSAYPNATRAPNVQRCDSVTSDQYFTGTLLNTAVANWTTLISNGTSTYCSNPQEDTAIAEALVRATVAGAADFSRFAVLRTISDVNNPPPSNVSAQSTSNLTSYNYFETVSQESQGYEPSLMNLYITMQPLIKSILTNWTSEWQAGIKPQSGYYGNILGTLDGQGVPAGAEGDTVTGNA